MRTTEGGFYLEYLILIPGCTLVSYGSLLSTLKKKKMPLNLVNWSEMEPGHQYILKLISK